jgi:two-component system, OmpR family, KDP operon response regulator KdpE
MNKSTILVIDDEPSIQKLLEITLESNDYKVQIAGSSKDGIIASAMHPPELIILDLGLPDEDGQQTLLKLREWYKNPIIILSARDNENDIILALDNGANDYLTKPFRAGELLARVRMALRFVQATEDAIKNFGNIQIDFASRIVSKNDEVVKLTATEYSLLLLLVQNEGRVLTHHHILKAIWGPSYTDQSQYLRVFIGQIRKKIEDNPVKPAYIITESGIGYRFIPNN